MSSENSTHLGPQYSDLALKHLARTSTSPERHGGRHGALLPHLFELLLGSFETGGEGVALAIAAASTETTCIEKLEGDTQSQLPSSEGARRARLGEMRVARRGKGRTNALSALGFMRSRGMSLRGAEPSAMLSVSWASERREVKGARTRRRVGDGERGEAARAVRPRILRTAHALSLKACRAVCCVPSSGTGRALLDKAAASEEVNLRRSSSSCTFASSQLSGTARCSRPPSSSRGTYEKA